MAIAAAARPRHASVSPAAPRAAARAVAARARGPLRVQAVAEFVHRAADRKEAILLAKLQGHAASTAAALVLKDAGKRPAGHSPQLGGRLWAAGHARRPGCRQGFGATPAGAAVAPACARPPLALPALPLRRGPEAGADQQSGQDPGAVGQ